MNNYSNLSTKKTVKGSLGNKKVSSQIDQIIDKDTINVVINDGKAYWVFENSVYEANVDKNGRIEAENALKINVFSLSENETKKLLSILDSISD